MSWQADFHVPEGIYLLSHSVGCQLRSAESALHAQVMKPWQQAGGDAWPAWLDGVAGFRQAIATLLNGQIEDVCPQTNLSSGFGKYLQALNLPVSRRVILMHEDAFPSMGFVVKGLEPLGYELRLIPSQHSAVQPTAWDKYLTPDVGVALITHVHSNTGWASPIEQLVERCRQQGIRTVVDVAQSAGVLNIDVQRWQADVVLGSCVKWLCGGPGAAFMWVNPNHSDDLTPVDVGWFSHASPFEFDIHRFEAAPGALRFWGGTPSVLPYVMATPSVAWLMDLGIETVQQHNRILTRPIREVAHRRDLWLVPEEHSGGTLCVPFTEPQLAWLLPRLEQKQVRYDRRGTVLRWSLHVYNSLAQAEQLAQWLEDMPA
ncbi:aminotransferase class V-fold PLP-dependent enzyme [Aestuariibacter halophilus]|uniref:Aminotransferase class V-fold PLP-dependent enzyme n=1 Tax=Fluctibacter halophilus TaxID=226011 RepID=A0ABS8GAE9_9ALTE|nr:aminotransferase class V-fold PLP-dependent enzyme [Aestuariibacter halophilus]MCC2617564.1 aminotransferase class V-fold PLP-dependent enzyme [Aestuariibacter halophilus]